MGSCCFRASSNKVHIEPEAIKTQVVVDKTTNNKKTQISVTDQPSHDSTEEWDYKNCENWTKHIPASKKNHQSPIDIHTSKAIFDVELSKSPIQLNFNSKSFFDISNNGHTFVVNGPSTDSLVSGCCLANPYRFAQFHMHWGSSDSNGSEHQVDGKSYSAELHFVNWNHVKYSSFKDAASSNDHDGLLVLGVLIIIGEENPEFEKLAELTDIIKLKGKSTQISKNFDVLKLFPNDMSKYYTYPGSLTTPPCTQSVKWVVLAQPIQISAKQLNKFRGLYSCCNASECSECNRIAFNFRPVCHLNKRSVYKSFK